MVFGGRLKVLSTLPRRLEDLPFRIRNKGEKPANNSKTSNQIFEIDAEATAPSSDTYDVVEPWLEKASNDHQPRNPLDSLAEGETSSGGSGQALSARDADGQLIGNAVSSKDDGPGSEGAENAFRLRLPPSHHQATKYADSDAGTPVSQAAHPLESELSSTTVIVNHHAQPSLTFTASIEDYAHKADPKNWGPLKFKKGQSVRIRPGTYAIPYKKLSESKHKYTQLGSYTRGTVHMVTSASSSSADPREFVVDEREVMYRIWIPGKVNRTVEFVFALEGDMQNFTECAACSGFATERCGGCNKVYYCSEYCLATDWKNHKADCKHKGKAHPALGSNSSARSDVSISTNSDGSKNAKQPLRREFREDGTVKITNGYEPPPEFHKGKMIIMPRCLRPLTKEDEEAEPSRYLALRLVRRQSHRFRRRLYKNRQPQIEAPMPLSKEATDYPETIFEDEENHGALNSNAVVPYSAGKSPLGKSHRMGYHNDVAGNDPLENSPMFGEEDELEPSSGKSAESVVEGGPQKSASTERSRFHRAFFARLPTLPPIRTSNDSARSSGDANAVDASQNDGTENKSSADGSSSSRPSLSEKIPRALKKISGRASHQASSSHNAASAKPKKGVIRPIPLRA